VVVEPKVVVDPAAEIPTLSTWGRVWLFAALLMAALFLLKRSVP